MSKACTPFGTSFNTFQFNKWSAILQSKLWLTPCSHCDSSHLKYWYIIQDSHIQYPLTRQWLVGMSCEPGYSCKWEFDINLWFSLLRARELAFSETFVNLMFVQVLISCDVETQTQCSLILRQKSYWCDQTYMSKMVMFPLWNQRVLVWPDIYVQSGYVSF